MLKITVNVPAPASSLPRKNTNKNAQDGSRGGHFWGALALGLGLVSLLINVRDFDLMDADFRSFYDSAAAWQSGRQVYTTTFRPNLNPPWFPILLSPLVPLGMAGAFAVWTAMNMATVMTTARLLLERRPEIPVVWLVLAFIVTPAWYAWHHGQVTWILFALVTRAWLSDRHAGFWLAPAIILKPPLALMALLLPWRVTLTAGLTAAAGTLALVLITGPSLWLEWLGAGQSVDLIAWVSNASLVGLAVRSEHWSVGGITVGDVSWRAWALVGAVGVVLAWQTIRQTRDRRWALAGLSSVLLSPLGWIYYLPVFTGPLLSVARGRWLVAVFALALIPRMTLITLGKLPLIYAVPLGSIACGLAACLWCAVMRPAQTRPSP